ncbi:helix-turn-helix domain-containing protein [Nevskia soli]|uniref:helix-turn-helix domain-containing protein n=1 Tax=Nevskia soli TaxID=418856 RepID=UPI0004A74F01|nr:helix-turn-helix transcriptional regulator [Nevskia soli]
MTEAQPGDTASIRPEETYLLRIRPIDLTLTEREEEILAFLMRGKSNREIATCIFRSEDTVKYHLKNIYQKLGVSGRLQAILVAIDMHPVNPPPEATARQLPR